MSKSHVGSPPWNKGLSKESDHRVARIGNRTKGRTPWNKGKKTGIAPWRGKKLSKEHRENIGKNNAKYWSGKKRPAPSEETRKKMSEAGIGRKPWNMGIPHSEDTKAKMKITRARQVLPRQDTIIEVKLQKLLEENGIRFETHHSILGQPDIFIKPNIAIFADGCYWHKCSDCGYGDGREKDREVTDELTQRGYVVLRFWEHEINKNVETCLSKIESHV